MSTPQTHGGENVAFSTGSLLSKWGFGDGDQLDDLLYDNGYGDVWETERLSLPDEAFSFDHRVLIRCVETFVLPQVREHHEITTYRIHTIHNPIRASLIDGEDVDDTSGRWCDLTPPTVEVPVAQVLAIAEEERVRHIGGPESER